MIGDLRFVDNAARVEHRAELLSTLGDAFAGMTRDQAVALLSSAQIVCGAIRSFDDVVEDKDVLASGILVEVAASEGDSFTSPGLAFTLDGRRRTSSAAAPAVGRDTVPVLEQLGFTDDEISRLFDGHVVAGATSHRTTSKGTRS